MKKLLIAVVSATLVLSVLSGCYYDEIVTIEGVPTNVSFKNDVLPILNKNCSTAGCHDSEPAHAPSMVSENAYQSLISGNYVNTLEPNKSKIYLEVSSGSMPPSGTLSPNDIKIILGWITDGAKNN